MDSRIKKAPDPATGNVANRDSLAIEIDRVRQDKKFMDTVKRLVERDREILDRLADN